MARRTASNTWSAAAIVILAFLIYAPYAIYQDVQNNKAKKQNDSLTQQIIGDVKVPGTIKDAKASGFTKCKNISSSLTYECESTKAVVIDGIAIQHASLQLNEYDNFKTAYSMPRDDQPTADTLTYRDIEIHDDAGALIKRLNSAGWVSYSERRSLSLYKNGINALFSVSIHGGRSSIELRPATASEVNRALEGVQETIERQKKEAADKAKVQSIMSSKE
jgi:hypothetical protein